MQLPYRRSSRSAIWLIAAGVAGVAAAIFTALNSKRRQQLQRWLAARNAPPSRPALAASPRFQSLRQSLVGVRNRLRRRVH